MVEQDGPTANGLAGIRAEFESPMLHFISDKCSFDDTNAAKKEIAAGHKGTN
jgi:hypothetical protein